MPGLILALRWPTSSWVLLDSAERRCRFLERAVDSLGMASAGLRSPRAEPRSWAAIRSSEAPLVVTARIFGSPAVTAECAAPFLEVGGRLLVSEPPSTSHRWPDDVAQVGLRVGARIGNVQVLEQRELWAERVPEANWAPGEASAGVLMFHGKRRQVP